MEEILDKFDRKLLYELDRDSSLPLNELSKRVGRTKQFVHFRMNKLEENGIINGYNAIIDMSKLGYFTFRLYFDFQRFIDENEKEFVAFLKDNLSQVWTITKMHGKWDYAIFIGVRTIKEFHDVWDKIMLNYKEKIKNYNVSLYSPVINFNRKIYLDKIENVVQRRYGDGEKEDLDDFDIKLIHTYAVNVRQSFLELANKLKVSHDKPRQQFLWENRADRVAHLGEFESVHGKPPSNYKRNTRLSTTPRQTTPATPSAVISPDTPAHATSNPGTFRSGGTGCARSAQVAPATTLSITGTVTCGCTRAAMPASPAPPRMTACTPICRTTSRQAWASSVRAASGSAAS